MNARPTSLAPSPPIPASPIAGMVRRPNQLDRDKPVFRRTEQFIRRHLAGLLGTASGDVVARFAVLDGPPGTGKSTATVEGCLRAGFSTVEVPAAALSGATENAATQQLSMFMEASVAHSHTTGDPTALIIHDFHLGIAGNTDAKIGRTVNSNLLAGEFQRLADHPMPYRCKCGTVIPIFFNGNDFSGTLPSLFRDGRANRHTHDPTPEEKQVIVWKMFNPQTTAEVNGLVRLLKSYEGQPIAFWAALRGDLLARHLDEHLPEGPLTREIVDALWPKRTQLDPHVVAALAQRRAAQTLDNHYASNRRISWLR